MAINHQWATLMCTIDREVEAEIIPFRSIAADIPRAAKIKM